MTAATCFFFFWGGGEGGGGEGRESGSPMLLNNIFPDVYVVASLGQICRAVPVKNSMHFEDVR